MKTRFELPKSLEMETRRLLCLIGLMFAMILLIQLVEVPNKSSKEQINTFSLTNITSELSETRNDSFVLDHDELSAPLESDLLDSNFSIVEKLREGSSVMNGNDGNITSDVARTISDHNVHVSNVSVHLSPKKPKSVKLSPPKENLTWSEMNELLIQSHLFPDSVVLRRSIKADEGLALAKSEIGKASSSNIDGLYGPLYRNASEFYRSYELMEQILKVYIYKEGDRPIFHTPPLQGIYASEGWFMKLLEESKHFVTKIPSEAHLFYLPFSSLKLEETLYVPNSHRHRNMIQHLGSYVDMISRKYPFWNRTYGADHFLVACHDWAPSETKRIMRNCIRALCNADVKEGFKFGKDVSLPETNVRNTRNPTRDRVKGKPPSKRKILAFFAGAMHGYLRPILLHHWGNNNNNISNNNRNLDMQIFNRLPHSKGDRNYIEYMKRSKYCICPRGYEVNSPRVVEAILYECVPVIISDNFVPPLFETLNWESFAVFVKEKDIPNLRNILVSIPQEKYVRMYMMVKKVQRHFLWHTKPIKYDLFHMILHSIWYNRVFQYRPR